MAVPTRAYSFLWAQSQPDFAPMIQQFMQEYELLPKSVVLPGPAMIDGVPVRAARGYLLVGHQSAQLNGVWEARGGAWLRR